MTSVLQRCAACPHGFAKMVGSRGDPRSPLVIVGESPGSQEIRSGLPFVGPSGAVLEHALKQHPDITPLFTNAIQCFPGTPRTKSQDRVTEATQCCQARLYAQLREHPRAAILALGNPAVWSTTGDFRTKITQVRGKLYVSPLARRGIVAAVHPAFLLRGGGSMRQFMADVDYACKLSKGESLKRYVEPQVHTATSVANVIWLAEQIELHGYCAADIETGGFSGFDFIRDRILCVGFCWDPTHVYVIPEHLVSCCRYIFRDNHRTKFIWHNGKFDVKFFWQHGIPARVDEDTLLCSYALDETKGIHDLEQISGDLLGAPDWKFMIQPYIQEWKKSHRKQPLPGYSMIPSPILHDYMAKDISGTLQCFAILRNQVRMDPQTELNYTRTLLPYSKYLARIEMVGMQPDLEQVSTNARDKQAEADNLELTLNTIAIDSGHGAFNPRSPIQVGTLLYDVLNLRDLRRPNKRPDSTDEDTLLTLPQCPAVKTLLKYREVQKALGTYVNSVAEHIGEDGRIHTSYLIHGTTTGRPASRNPNVLNIPRDPLLRGQFIASPGKVLLEIDVNQAELRVLAELSRDPTLHYIYTTPGAPSIHKVTQTEMYGDPSSYSEAQWQIFMEKFSTQGDRKRTLEEQNMRAKCVNFGIVYGRTAPSIAEEFRMPTQEAQDWINKWFQKYAVAREFILACRSAPLKGQNLVTPFGRKRRFQIVNREKLNDIQNQAANFPEQSIACDIVTHTGILIQETAFREYGAHIVNTVYDSIMFEMPIDPKRTPADQLIPAYELGARTLSLLAEVPKHWGLRTIPFKGSLKIGTRWGSDPDNKFPTKGYLKEVQIPSEILERVAGMSRHTS